MNTIQASAPGKVILFGEHAVVYGQPAIAAPVAAIRARAAAQPALPGAGLSVYAAELGQSFRLRDDPEEPLIRTAALVLQAAGLSEPDVELTVESDIPIASGLGSGAAVSAALARALAAFVGHSLGADELSALVYEVETIHHGTPSGIDNTVVCYEKPVYFVRGCPPRLLHIGAPLHLVIADTGLRVPTKQTVGDVRAQWQQTPARLEVTFAAIGQIARRARRAIQTGEVDVLGPLMDQNQALLTELDVSSPEIEALVAAARAAGAKGAKLAGGGRGGNVIALVDEPHVEPVTAALIDAGATAAIQTEITPEPESAA